mmetsp:Transcript_15726/g.34300  ORF Transcript_15726/g.34300 Transcript_15726/m.34300 type:complete len:702 (+) Transcript_15726:54-2159(+)
MAIVHQLGATQRRLPQILAQRARSRMHFVPPMPSLSPAPVAGSLSGRTATTRARASSSTTAQLRHYYRGRHHTASSSVINSCGINDAVASSRSMSSNTPRQHFGDDVDGGDGGVEGTLDPKVLANIYNHRRAKYNRAVSALRKKYFDEFEARRERERRTKAAEEAKLRRETLERRRRKAMRSAENERKANERREKRRLEWERELAITQRERDEKKEIYTKARQKIVDQLEAECHLWLTTPEEVERALGNPTASQVLWSRPGGMIGAPSGPDTGFGDFGEFWRYECHTWDSSPTYKTPREVMLEELEYMSYLRTNNNERYWTRERVREHEMMEQRARLRAVVREEGRRSLLNKQREMMRDVYGNEEENDRQKEHQKGNRLPPTSMPAPKLDYLADYEAQEREGVEIMRRDPRRFFVFESDLPSRSGGGNVGGTMSSEDEDSGSAAGGASLGRPVAIRNPFFGDRPTAFPIRMGRDMPDDTRTEKEKKRDERQERMRAAAEEAALAASKGASFEVAMAAEEDLEDGSEDVDYDKAEEEAEKELWVDQEEQWGDADRKVFDMTPPFARLTPDDIDWIVDQLNTKVRKTEERLDFEDKIRRKEMEKMMGGGATKKPIESLDEVDRYVMEGLGYDMDAIEAMVRELTPEQSAALDGIDFAGRDAAITAEEMASELRTVPGLTEDQIGALVEMEMRMLKDEALKNIK